VARPEEQASTDVSAAQSKILVVEDDEALRCLTTMILESEGYHVRACADLAAARAALEEYEPDVVTLDMQLPDGPGLDLLTELQGNAMTVAIPVIVVTGTVASDFIATALAAGAQDFIRKPFEPVELEARVGAGVRVKRIRDELSRLATQDALTGLPNRRGLLQSLDTWMAHGDRSGESLALAMFDVIDFKSVNDDSGTAPVTAC
jgi:two-component system cell cycle response regulator